MKKEKDKDVEVSEAATKQPKPPAKNAAVAGRYKCPECGKLIQYKADNPLPPCPVCDGPVEWELVYALPPPVPARDAKTITYIGPLSLVTISGLGEIERGITYNKRDEDKQNPHGLGAARFMRAAQAIEAGKLHRFRME